MYKTETIVPAGKFHTKDYLVAIGVPEIAPSISPFDPGYDPVTLESHLDQSAHLISILKIADIGVTRIECGEGFTEMTLKAADVVKMASERGLDVQFELGKKHTGAFTEDGVTQLIEQGRRWLDAGALQLVVEARESAKEVGLFDDKGNLHCGYADRFAKAFGLDTVMFEAPNKASQFALLNHLGREVHLCNVRLEELLRVEIYRRGLHSDAFARENLRPVTPNPVRPRAESLRSEGERTCEIA